MHFIAPREALTVPRETLTKDLDIVIFFYLYTDIQIYRDSKMLFIPREVLTSNKILIVYEE